MRQYQKPNVYTDEEYDKIQMQEWLFDSHYWVEMNRTFVCKWCGRPTTTTLSGDAVLCKNNPELLKDI